MKKIMNSADTFVKDTVEGITAAYSDKVKLLNGDYRVLLSNYPTAENKVGVVTAGGSGHPVSYTHLTLPTICSV